MGNAAPRIMSTLAACPKSHWKCRGGNYPRTKDVARCPVPDDRVSWETPLPGYQPVDHTAPSVLAQPVWADTDFRTGPAEVRWNEVDGDVNRASHMGAYSIEDRVPRNPVGRTGVRGRGLLGRWGPNHAADPIVTRWKRSEAGDQLEHPTSKRKILQFIAIKRGDSGEWAIPGGMVDPGEHVTTTLRREFEEEALNMGDATEGPTKTLANNLSNFFSQGKEGMVGPGETVSLTLSREFGEEALNTMEADEAQRERVQRHVEDLFAHGTEVYRGYVDDPRNTDQAWMETVAFNFHDESGDSVGRFKLHAGDDAVGVKWTDVDGRLNLYASHIDFIKEVAHRHNAHW